MNLYRMTYLRGDPKPKGSTFTARSAERAVAFAEKWVAGFKGKLLTVKFIRPCTPQGELELMP